MVINPIIGFYIPIIRIPIKGGMTIPNIATFDHGTFGAPQMQKKTASTNKAWQVAMLPDQSLPHGGEFLRL